MTAARALAAARAAADLAARAASGEPEVEAASRPAIVALPANAAARDDEATAATVDGVAGETT